MFATIRRSIAIPAVGVLLIVSAQSSAAVAAVKRVKGGPLAGLLDSLNLSDAQRQAIRASIADIREQNENAAGENALTADQKTQFRDLAQQLHAAKQSGDESQVT